MNDPRGSIWRKWDLHVHTPASIINHYPGTNEGEKWDNFISNIESLPQEFKVIGISDYVFIDGYKKILEYRRQGRLSNIELFLPVVEMRISKFAGVDFGSFGRINLHVIFSNEIGPDTIQNQFINRLSQGYKLAPGLEGMQWNGIITMESLADLGKMIKETSPLGTQFGNVSDTICGFNNLNCNEDQIFESLQSHYFSNKYLIGIGKTEWADLWWSDHSISEKKDIINKANIVFTAADNPENWKKAKDKLKEQNVNNLLLDCSDAHHLSDKQDKDRIGNCFTWIKADPTFEGLKQIVCEPEERVYIGRSIPKSKNDANVIDRIEIKESNHWFEEEPILLNENLVTVIGEKGAGKTALADFVALAGGDFDVKGDDPGSFVSKALKSTKQIEDTIDKCIVTIYWRDENQDHIKITENFEDYKDTKKVRYLSQSFIERKCRPEMAEELQKEIENIIFQHIPIQDRMAQTTFFELKKLKTQSIKVKKTICSKQISVLNDEIFTLEEEINSLAGKKEEKIKLETEIGQLEQQKPKPQTEEERSTEAKLTLLNNRKNTLIEKIVALNLKLSTIETIKVKVASLKEYVQGEIADIKKSLESIDLATLYEKLKFSVEPDFDTTLENEKKVIETQIKKFQGTQEPDKPSNGGKQENELTETYISALDLNKVNILITAHESKSGIAESARKTIRSFDEKITKNQRRIEELDKSIKNIEDTKKPLLPTKKTERDTAYKNYFVLLQKEKQILEDIYSPLKEKMNEESMGEKNQIDFFARIELNVDEFFNNADSIIDFSKIGTYYRNSDFLRKEIKSLAEKIEIGEESDVLSLITHLYKTFEESDGKPVEINSQLLRSKNKNRLDFYKWIFDVSDFKVNYSIKYQGTNIELLSPGKKGIVLLLMYLGLDTESSIPLIIDQPEENLDNKSLYPYLVDYFKIAKKRRQIIIITHNPNLVLNADAEQIIVANFEAVPTVYKSRITYMSGGIENSYINRQLQTPLRQQGIREHGADILESGKIAFIKRKDRYEY